MLTLTRKVGETIRIGDDVQIIVKENRKNQVRIGIVAPRDVKIYREEVYQNIVAENRSAAQVDPDALNLILGGGAGKLTKPGKKQLTSSEDSSDPPESDGT